MASAAVNGLNTHVQTGWICQVCLHEPEGEYGHINQITTVHVTCVTGPVTINHVSAIQGVSNCWIGI